MFQKGIFFLNHIFGIFNRISRVNSTLKGNTKNISWYDFIQLQSLVDTKIWYLTIDFLHLDNKRMWCKELSILDKS